MSTARAALLLPSQRHCELLTAAVVGLVTCPLCNHAGVLVCSAIGAHGPRLLKVCPHCSEREECSLQLLCSADEHFIPGHRCTVCWQCDEFRDLVAADGGAPVVKARRVAKLAAALRDQAEQVSRATPASPLLT